MSEFIYKIRFVILFFILLLGLYLRHHNLYTWPRLGATFDEYAWTWLGMNLIQNQTPESWSPHQQYQNRKIIKYQGAYFSLVKPYLEHPPFFGLIAGGWAIANGVKDIYHTDLNHIRSLALLLGVLSIFIMYIFAAQIYGFKIGLLSSLIYATVPTVVIGSRIVENENFFIPIFLLSLYLISKFINTNNPWYRNLAAVLCGLLVLAKMPWITAAVAIVLILLYFKKTKDIYKFLLIFVPIFSLFIIYGFYFDGKLFVDLWKLQLQRYDLTFNSVFALFTSPYLVDRFTIDGWIYFGWFAIFLLAVKDIKKNIFIILPFLAYLFIFIFAIPNEPSHGWYRYPFYPFLIISTALFLKEYFNKNYFLTFMFLIFTGLSMLQLSIGQSVGFSFIVFRGFLVLFGLSLLPYFFPSRKNLSTFASYISFIIILVLNIWAIRGYNEQ
jgi:4-amino-4-deoxy-L-arabinose transferase-like glycosyltransferase